MASWLLQHPRLLLKINQPPPYRKQYLHQLSKAASALLYEAGQGSFVDSAFVQNVVAVQNVDCGWSRSVVFQTFHGDPLQS
jgi:hypothetical protein